MTSKMPRILIDAHPRLRVMWLSGSGWKPWCGDCSYYGWRWQVGIGPLLMLVGQSCEDITDVTLSAGCDDLF